MPAAVSGNLLGNTVYHNDADEPLVRVSATTTHGTVTVGVADNGPGIPDDRKASVFRRGNSTSGGGFGLFFVRIRPGTTPSSGISPVSFADGCPCHTLPRVPRNLSVLRS